MGYAHRDWFYQVFIWAGILSVVSLSTSVSALVPTLYDGTAGQMTSAVKKSKCWLPIVTHFENGAFKPGGVETRYTQAGANPPVSLDQWSFSNTVGQTIHTVDGKVPFDGDLSLHTEATTIPAKRIVDLCAFLEMGNDGGLFLYDDTSKIVSGATAFQLVPNVLFNPTHPMLAHLLLPPNWSKEKSYPIVITCDWLAMDHNDRLFNFAHDPNRTYKVTDDFILAKYCALSPRNGVIMAIVNGGGREAFGIQKEAFNSVAQIIDCISKKYGGNKNQVVFYGYSRGGLTAIAWGSNPNKADYKTVGIFAQSGFTELGTSLGGPLNVFNVIPAAINFAYPSPLNQEAISANNALDYLLRSTGYTTVAEANANSGMGLIEQLKANNNIQILSFAVPTKDSWHPLYPAHEYYRKAIAAAIPVRLHSTIGAGHAASKAEINADLMAFTSCLATGKSPEVCAQSDSLKQGKYYYKLTAFEPNAGTQIWPQEKVVTKCIPSSVRVAGIMKSGQPTVVEVVAEKGKKVEVSLEGHADVVINETMGESRYIYKTFTVTGSGTFKWNIKVGDKVLTRTPDLKTDGAKLIVKDEIGSGFPYSAVSENNFNWERGYGVDEVEGIDQTCDPVPTVAVKQIFRNHGTTKNSFSVNLSRSGLRIGGQAWNTGVVRSVSVASVTGRQIFSTQSIAADSRNTLTINTPLAAGTYIVSVASAQSIVRQMVNIH